MVSERCPASCDQRWKQLLQAEAGGVVMVTALKRNGMLRRIFSLQQGSGLQALWIQTCPLLVPQPKPTTHRVSPGSAAGGHGAQTRPPRQRARLMSVF